jgi:glycosyltransferase involved in cell wall biosynthesis
VVHLEVVIDGRALVGDRTGIAVHTAAIASRLDVTPPPLIASHREIANRDHLEHCRFRVDHAPLGVLWQQTMLPRIAGDVLWAPHGTLPLAGRMPSVITIHDLSSLTMPGRHRIKTVLSFNVLVGRSLERATRIAAVSRVTADDLVRSFGIASSRIAIVPNGVDELFTPEGGEGDYILFAGTLEPRKGIDDLLAAWRSLPRPAPRLVICGGAGWGNVVTLGEGVEATGYVSQERLRELYRHAIAFVYPSRHEGFGIPPLEAMACGAPVIATKTGAIPEYGEGIAMLVDPGDVEGLRRALRRLLGDRPLRDEMRARGPQRASHYRWDRSAALMTELLTDAAGHGR